MSIRKNLQPKTTATAPEAPTAPMATAPEVPTAPQAPTATATPASAGVTPVSGVKLSSEQKKAKFSAFKATGASARAKMTEEEKQKEGSMSDALEFIIALGNPKVPQRKMQKGQEGSASQIIGYKFKALKPCKVAQVPLNPAPKNVNDVDMSKLVMVDVQAGQEVVMNSMEAAITISQPEFGGYFTGGGQQLCLHVTISSQRAGLPLGVLKRVGGSLKDKVEDVAKKGDNGYVVFDQYKEKFGQYFVKHTSSRPRVAGQQAGESAKDLAAAFRIFVQKTAN